MTQAMQKGIKGRLSVLHPIEKQSLQRNLPFSNVLLVDDGIGKENRRIERWIDRETICLQLMHGFPQAQAVTRLKAKVIRYSS